MKKRKRTFSSYCEDGWAEGAQLNARQYLDNPGKWPDYFSYYVTMQNVAGTVLQYPFGYNLSFPSKMHISDKRNAILASAVYSDCITRVFYCERKQAMPLPA